MTKKFIFLLLLMFTGLQIMQAQQTYSIKGIVKDAANGEPVSFANVVIWNTIEGTVTDSIGQFEITGVSPGSYRLQASFIGYKPTVTAEFRISNKDMFFPIELEESSESLQEVSIVASPFRKTAESPLGLRVIGFKEIEKSAGGNRDISRVVQSFPGVASTAAFRNDLMVRGGGPSENRFFLDGVEIPNINHFSTQGASGGPVGIINPDFIREVDFYSAAYPAARGNALSSVLDFKLQDGNKEKILPTGSDRSFGYRILCQRTGRQEDDLPSVYSPFIPSVPVRHDRAAFPADLHRRTIQSETYIRPEKRTGYSGIGSHRRHETQHRYGRHE